MLRHVRGPRFSWLCRLRWCTQRSREIVALARHCGPSYDPAVIKPQPLPPGAEVGLITSRQGHYSQVLPRLGSGLDMSRSAYVSICGPDEIASSLAL